MFKDVLKVPEAYYANNKAWITGNIYEKLLKDLYSRFEQRSAKLS